MTTRQEDLQSRIDAVEDIPVAAFKKPKMRWNAHSGNILDDDLGQFSDSIKFDYELDKTTRDRLIAHARQDSAMAFLAAADVYQYAKSANKNAWLAVVFAFVAMCASLYIAFSIT